MCLLNATWLDKLSCMAYLATLLISANARGGGGITNVWKANRIAHGGKLIIDVLPADANMAAQLDL